MQIKNIFFLSSKFSADRRYTFQLDAFPLKFDALILPKFILMLLFQSNIKWALYDEEDTKWEALEKLPTFYHLRKGLLFKSQSA